MASASQPRRVHRFDFSFDRSFRLLARCVGVRDGTTQVEVGEGMFDARFGPWRVRTPLSNVVDAQITGPYSFFKTVGPAHLSMADRGLTFATNRRRGVCVRFARPVTGIEPFGVLCHPGLTVTVDDVEELVDVLPTLPGIVGDPRLLR